MAGGHSKRPGGIPLGERTRGEPWEAFVVHLRKIRDRWVTVREWMPADSVTLAAD